MKKILALVKAKMDRFEIKRNNNNALINFIFLLKTNSSDEADKFNVM